jgi:hypothetical protein
MRTHYLQTRLEGISSAESHFSRTAADGSAKCVAPVEPRCYSTVKCASVGLQSTPLVGIMCLKRLPPEIHNFFMDYSLSVAIVQTREHLDRITHTVAKRRHMC